MTINKKTHTGYEGRFGEVTSNSPTGSYKNKTDSSTNDGSFLEQDWANDWYDGLNGAFLANVHDASTGEPTGYTDPFNQDGTVTLNENVDNAQASQVYNAWYKKTQDVADGRIAAKQLEEKIAALETLAEGCWFTYYSGGKYVQGGLETMAGSASLVDFNFNNGYTETNGNNVGTEIVNKNNITVSTDGLELTFLKAGMYTVKPVFFVTSSTNFASKFQFQINKPSVGSYEDYTGETNISSYAMHFEQGTGVNTQYNPTRSGAIDVNDTVVSTTFSQYLAFGTSQTDFMIAVEEDNTKLKLQTKIIDNDEVSPSYFNFQLSLFRIGKYISDYTLPTDIVVAP